MSDWLGLLWLIVLILGNAFFVAAEFAVVSARQDQLEPQLPDRRARRALEAMRNVGEILATCQLGIMVCSLLLLLVSEPALHHLLAQPLKIWGVPREIAEPAVFLIAFVVVSGLHVVAGEMVPKNISFSLADRSILFLAGPLLFFWRLFRPITMVLNRAANLLLRIFGVQAVGEIRAAYTLDEVRSIVGESTREGLLTDRAGTVEAALNLEQARVLDLQIPLAQVASVPLGATAEEVKTAITVSGYSRLLVNDDTGEPLGYLHLKDILGLLPDSTTTGHAVPLRLIRRLSLVSCNVPLVDALATMQRSRSHVALTYDPEAGRLVRGLIFLQDIVSRLAGTLEVGKQK